MRIFSGKKWVAPVAFLALFTCTASAFAADTIRINGTGSGLVLMAPLFEAYSKVNRGVTFDMRRSLGSSGAIKAIGKGAIDIAVSGRPLNVKEQTGDLTFYEYGRTPFALVSNPKHPHEENFSTDRIADVFSGRTATWRDGDSIRVVLRPLEDVDTKITRSISAEMDRAVTAAHQKKDAIIGITDNDAFETLRKTPDSVGFIALVMVISDPGAVKVNKLNGVEPTVKNLAVGKYPIYKDFFVVTRKNPSPAVNDFLHFLNSEKGRAISLKSGVVVTTKAR